MAYCQQHFSFVFLHLFPHAHICIETLSTSEKEACIRRAKLLGLLLRCVALTLSARERLARFLHLMKCFLCLPSANVVPTNETVFTGPEPPAQTTQLLSGSVCATEFRRGLSCPCVNSCIRLFMFGYILQTYLLKSTESAKKIFFNLICALVLGTLSTQTDLSTLIVDNVPGL